MGEYRTIRVTGKGEMSVKLDLIRLSIDLEGVYEDYGETLFISSQQTENLRSTLETIGFDKSDLKTLSFSVDTEYNR